MVLLVDRQTVDADASVVATLLNAPFTRIMMQLAEIPQFTKPELHRVIVVRLHMIDNGCRFYAALLETHFTQGLDL